MWRCISVCRSWNLQCGREDQTADIAGWLETLGADRKLLIDAAVKYSMRRMMFSTEDVRN